MTNLDWDRANVEGRIKRQGTESAFEASPALGPLDPAFAVDPLEVADQEHAEVAPGRQRLATSGRGRIMRLAERLDMAVETGTTQDLLQPVVEAMPSLSAIPLSPNHGQADLVNTLLSDPAEAIIEERAISERFTAIQSGDGGGWRHFSGWQAGRHDERRNTEQYCPLDCLSSREGPDCDRPICDCLGHSALSVEPSVEPHELASRCESLIGTFYVWPVRRQIIWHLRADDGREDLAWSA